MEPDDGTAGMEPDDEYWLSLSLPEFCADDFVDSMTRTQTSPQQRDHSLGHVQLLGQRGADDSSGDEGTEEYRGHRPDGADEERAGKDEGNSITRLCAGPGTTEIGSLGFTPNSPDQPSKDSMLGKRKRLGYIQGEDGAWEWEGLSPEDICRILLEHWKGTSASSFPEIPVFSTWPSKQCTTRANAQSLQSHWNTPECKMTSVEELELGRFWRKLWIR